jgi:hypothetical protein
MNPKPFTILTIGEIHKLLSNLEEMQTAYFEEAIEASQYKDANDIINHVRSL